MREEIGSAPSTPWDGASRTICEAVRNRMGDDVATLIALFDAKQPAADEILVRDGIESSAVLAWLRRGFQEDRLMATAIHQGSASGSITETGWLPSAFEATSSFAYQMLPDSMTFRRWWFVAVVHPTQAFDDDKLNGLGRMLRQWKSHFNRPLEPEMARLIIGHDDRLIHGDPHGEQMLMDHGVEVDSLMEDLRSTVQQRWPRLEDGVLHDLSLRLSDEPWWIRFRRLRAIETPEAAHWYLELRPLREGELVPIGIVADPRIALSLAYIHDHYADSPTLSDIADSVHVSPFHFHRLFTREVGVTPKQYVLQKQVQVARWMLRSNRAAISRIAKDTGFASHGHFTSTFRRLVGVSPSQYRQVSTD